MVWSEVEGTSEMEEKERWEQHLGSLKEELVENNGEGPQKTSLIVL